MKISKAAIKVKVRGAYDFVRGDLRTYWNKPHDGEFLSYKQFVQYCVGAMGINIFFICTTLIGFGFNYFCGSIFGLRMRDFNMIGIIGTIMGYIFIWMSPVGMLMYENHGRLEKKTKWMLHGYSIFRLAAGIPLYFVDPNIFPNIMVGFPQIVANVFVIGTFFDYVNWAIRYYLCPKYGRVKPYVVVGAIPAAIFYSVIPWLPIASMTYVQRLLILHTMFYFGGTFAGYFTGYGGMINFMTQNTQERQRVLSWSPIITGLIKSIINMFLPTLIVTGVLFGHTLTGYEDIWAYRIFCPIFSVIAVLFGMAFLPVKEHLVEQKVDRPKVHFWKGARQVFHNKYLWITTISGFLGGFCLVSIGLTNWWMIYRLRNTWAMGLVTSIISFGSVGANIVTPLLTKRFEKQKIYVWGRVISVLISPVFYLLYRFDIFWLYVALQFFYNMFNTVINGIGNGIGGDIMDYHQWKFGERCDSVSGVIGWLTSPFTMVLSYLGPLVYRSLGYTSDFGVLYDPAILRRLVDYSYAFGIVVGLMCIVPYFWYDLTSEKHRQYITEIKERVRAADTAAFIRRIQNGTDHEVDADTIKKLLDEGIDVEALRAEYSVAPLSMPVAEV